jgi:hypothetical protein
LEGENRKATSIAFPPLGAGRFRYPSDVIVEQMIKSIKEYLMENGADTCLRHIYMHDVEKESSLLFVKAMKNEIPQSTILIPGDVPINICSIMFAQCRLSIINRIYRISKSENTCFC